MQNRNHIMLHVHILMEIPEHSTGISFFGNNFTMIAYLHRKKKNVTYTSMLATRGGKTTGPFG